MNIYNLVNEKVVTCICVLGAALGVIAVGIGIALMIILGVLIKIVIPITVVYFTIVLLIRYWPL